MSRIQATSSRSVANVSRLCSTPCPRSHCISKTPFAVFVFNDGISHPRSGPVIFHSFISDSTHLHSFKPNQFTDLYKKANDTVSLFVGGKREHGLRRTRVYKTLLLRGKTKILLLDCTHRLVLLKIGIDPSIFPDFGHGYTKSSPQIKKKERKKEERETALIISMYSTIWKKKRHVSYLR